MRLTFFCESCRSELTVVPRLAGRTILCPRCRRKTRIPASNSASESPLVADAPTLPGSFARESTNAFIKPCADFASNPFAFSVRLEAFVPSNNDGDTETSNVETSASKTPSVNELIATLLDEENH